MKTSIYEPLDLERVAWGDHLDRLVAKEVEKRGSVRPLIVVSPSCRRKTSIIDRLISTLPATPVEVFDAISPHVSRTSVMAVARLARETRADLIITIGGGSAIDTVKVALAALAADIRAEDDLASLAVRTAPDGRPLAPPMPPPPFRQIVAPTTLSGAEFSDLAGCMDPVTQVKQLFTGRAIGSASVLLDPSITLSTPIDIWLSTGVRALDHAVETLCSSESNSYVDALAAQALATLARTLRQTRADPADLRARLDSQLAVWMACAGLNRVPWGASHGIGHQLGAVAGIPHGYCSCILLPHVLAFNAPANADRQAAVAVALGDSGRSANAAVRQLIVDLGLPTRLRDVGVRPEMLPVIAETSLGNLFVRQNPRPIREVAGVMEILEAAF
jgi:alcohol dehydrogenase class IV